jgi:hypothetical protein
MVADFAEAAEKLEYLPAGRVPNMESPEPIPKAPVHPKSHAKGSSSSKGGSHSIVDVEMEDVPPTESGRKALTNVPQQASGSKREFQDSPTRPSAVKKRQRATIDEDDEDNKDDVDANDEVDDEGDEGEATGIPTVGLDLSWLVVDEDSKINFGEFSPAQGQVRACDPRWKGNL